MVMKIDFSHLEDLSPAEAEHLLTNITRARLELTWTDWVIGGLAALAVIVWLV